VYCASSQAQADEADGIGPSRPPPGTKPKMAPIPVVDEPPGEEEAEQKYQEKVKAEEEAKKEADKKKVMYYDPNTGQMTTEDPDNPEPVQEEKVWIELVGTEKDKKRSYWYNKETKERSWTEPVELKEEAAAEEEVAAEEEPAAKEEEGPEWSEYQTEDGIYFWNSHTEPPVPSWGPPPSRIRVTAEEQERRDALMKIWQLVEPQENDEFSPDGTDFYYNPLSKQATKIKPGEKAYEAVPAWEERVDKTGKKYYFDRRYKKIAWKPPPDIEATVYKEGRIDMITLDYDPRPPQPEPEEPEDPPTDEEEEEEEPAGAEEEPEEPEPPPEPEDEEEDSDEEISSDEEVDPNAVPNPAAALAAVQKKIKREKLAQKVKEKMKQVLERTAKEKADKPEEEKGARGRGESPDRDQKRRDRSRERGGDRDRDRDRARRRSSSGSRSRSRDRKANARRRSRSRDRRRDRSRDRRRSRSRRR